MLPGKRPTGGWCASSYPINASQAHALPVIEVTLEGRRVRALVDTGCATTVVCSRIVGGCKGVNYMVAFDGSRVKCQGKRELQLGVRGIDMSVEAIVSERILNGIDIVLGMDVVDIMGGVTVLGKNVEFGTNSCNAVLQYKENIIAKPMENMVGDTIEDKDFKATFNGRHWTVEWVWKSDPPVLTNKIKCYDRQLQGEKKKGFEEEIERWIKEGILLPWKEEVEIGIIPLMAVEQPTKGKIRPVLDFRELNVHVSSHTGDEITDVCNEILRDWRQTTNASTIVDLKSAYLQIHVSKDLWKYQLVSYKGRTYCLTRLGFGLNSAPRIMAKVLKTVLGRCKKIESATKSYIDDILLDESKVTSEELISHLNDFGFVTKPPEQLDGGAALGLKLRKNDRGELQFSRGNKIPEVVPSLNRRELFSVCGKLVGHYPVAGWLRVACSYMKRAAEGTGWEDSVGDAARGKLNEVLHRVKNEDPVRGKWYVPKTTKGTVWCDASSIALGILLEIDGNIVEDAAWLRSQSDSNHINVAELEAAMKGINMAIKWGLQEVEIITDSATVNSWIATVVSEEKRVQTKGAAEMLVKRRLGILKSLIVEFNMKLTVKLVPSCRNKSDALTRVKKEWLVAKDKLEDEDMEVCCAAGCVDLRAHHNMHHMGVDRSLYLARQVAPDVSRTAVKKIVQSCEKCQSIDPAPRVHERGNLSVHSTWQRLAIDVTHFHQVCYLSIVDCGPGRFAIWRQLKRETAECIVNVLDEVFLERGPVSEVLMDNALSFHSETMTTLLRKWHIKGLFRAAYRPSGNGIVERHHRTIKASAERGNFSPQEAVYWYNMSPRSGIDPNSVPQRAIYQYKWRQLQDEPEEDVNVESANVVIDDEVWVKPPDVRCTSKWKRGRVTGITSKNNVEVDGTPRHILDIRRVVSSDFDSESDSEEGKLINNDQVNMVENDSLTGVDEVTESPRYPVRTRQPPAWMADYDTT